VWPQGESALWAKHSEYVAPEWCSGGAAEAVRDPLSACPPKIAAATSQHGNNAVLSQNAAQATINPTRASPRRPRGRLASDIRAVLCVHDNISVASGGPAVYLTSFRI